MSNDRNKWTYIDIKLASITFLYITISKQIIDIKHKKLSSKIRFKNYNIDNCYHPYGIKYLN